jgi:cytoskeletal protein CcmA (bactofilin family)
VALAPGASRIAADLKLDGEISGDSDLYIDGELRGKIHMAGARVTVGPKGRIRADIEARDIVINGSVEGSLKAAESVRLGSASRVLGKVLAPRIGIDDGAVLRGMVETIPAGPVPEPIANLRDADAEALRPVSVGIKDEQSTP